MWKKSSNDPQLPFDYNNPIHDQYPTAKPSLSKYIFMIVIPYMIVSSIAFGGLFTALYDEVTPQMIAGVLMIYWGVVWLIYAVVKVVHNTLFGEDDRLTKRTKTEIQSQVNAPILQTEVESGAMYGQARTSTGESLQFRAKAVQQEDYAYIFKDDSISQKPRNNAIEKKMKRQFAYIRWLIKNQKYKEARYALSVIDHPKADDWLVKLNRIDSSQDKQPIILKWLAVVSIIVLLLMNLIVSIYDIVN